jgi:PncC family amidohydrolase
VESVDRRTSEVIQKVHKLFRKEGLTLSVAESCTGGLISHYITALPGASNFFDAGVVSYSAEAKRTILGVSSETVSKYGVVSDQTAREMAEKVSKLVGTDFSLSTTGNLGPDTLEGKEKGLVYISVSRAGGISSRELRLKGNREENKEKAALAALEFLLKTAEECLCKP